MDQLDSHDLFQFFKDLVIEEHDCRQFNFYFKKCTRVWYQTKYMYVDANLEIL